MRYFYVLTVQILNPMGGVERVKSASGTFYSDCDMTQEDLFQDVVALSNLDPGLDGDAPVTLDRIAVLFYMCMPNED